jgi:hypothetical protein
LVLPTNLGPQVLWIEPTFLRNPPQPETKPTSWLAPLSLFDTDASIKALTATEQTLFPLCQLAAHRKGFAIEEQFARTNVA